MVGRFLRAVRRKQSELGGFNAVAFIARRLWDTLFHSRDLFFSIGLSDRTLTAFPADRAVEVREKRSFGDLTAKEQAAIRGYGGDSLLGLFKKRFATGYRLFLTYMEEDLAGAAWVYTGGPERFFMVPLAEEEFFIVAVFILEKFRGRGLSLPSLLLLLKKMREDGFRRGFICTKEWNYYQRTIRKAGFELAGKVRRVAMPGKIF